MTYREPYRPQFHYTPARNWMNDPNGLVYYRGVYHLFYQYNPTGPTWGEIAWGHAVSRDLVHWRERGAAIQADEKEYVFSGSIVIDENNTSGFGTARNPAMVAVYTSAARDSHNQSQALAYSTDEGRTWTKYAGNPVLDIGSGEFRDPKVFWHAPARRWVMSVVLSLEHQVSFYGSNDLKSWTHLSDFGPANAVGGVWEVPDLFPLNVDGDPRRPTWVLVVNLNPGGVAGGSAAQYFVGRFDGTTFTADNGRSDWLDHGKDYYAAVSWNNLPAEQRTMIGWMSNWQYATSVPTAPWRGAMSVPRRVELRTIDGRVELVQNPVQQLDRLRTGPVFRLNNKTVRAGTWPLDRRRASGRALDIDATFDLRTADRFGLKVRVGDGEETVIGYDALAHELYVDRTRSGQVGFSRDFPGVHRAPLTATGERLQLRILVDRSSVEVFADHGRRVITDQIFPSETSRGVELFVEGGRVRLTSLRIHHLQH